MRPFYLILTLVSFALSYFSIQDDRIYDVDNDKLYSDKKFINILSSDSSFYNDENFKKYQKSYNNLQFRKNWWTHLILISSWGAGIEGIKHPERWEEGGDNYDLDKDNNPPGFDTIIIGSIFYASYHGYNKIRKDRSLYRLIQDYNLFYFNKPKESNLPHSFVDDIKNGDSWKFSLSYGFSNEKVSPSIADASIMLNINQHNQFYVTSGIHWGGGFGLGYKYYFKSNIKTSFFTGVSLSSGMYGSGYSSEVVRGINFSSGYSILRKKRSKKNMPSLYINLGLVISYTDSKVSKFSLVPLPLINLEYRF